MDSTFAAEKPARPVVAPPDAPLAPGIENKPAPAAAAAAVAHRSASLSGSSTRRDGEITENEKADSALEPATEVAPKTRPDEGTNKGEALPEPAEEHQWISGMQLFTVMAGVVLACFLMFLDTTVIVTAIPYITNDFHSLSDVGWYGSAYQLASAALQPLTGKVFSHFSSKWSFLFFFLIFELGSLICGVAPSSTVFIIGRAVAGMGVSGLFNGGLTIIAGSVPLERRPQLVGILMGLSQLGLLSGPLIGGALTQYVTWRWCFYINLPIGGLVAVLLTIPKVPDQIPKAPWRTVVPEIPELFDLFGFVLIAGGAIELLLALQYGGNQYAWNSSVVIGLFVGSGLTFIAWFVWNYRKGDKALIPFSMMRKTVVWSAAISSAMLFGTVFSASFFLPIYFQAVKGTSPFISGVNLLPSILPTMLFAVSSGVLVGKLGYYIPWAIASGVITTIGMGLFSMLEPATSTAMWAGFQILVGAGRGMGLQMGILAIQSVLPPDQISVSLSLLVFTQYLLGAVFLTLANTIFDTGLRSELSAIPGLNADKVIAAGATAFRSFVPPAQLGAVVAGYATSLNRVFYFAAGLGFLMFATSWGLGWNDVRKKKEPEPAEP